MNTFSKIIIGFTVLLMLFLLYWIFMDAYLGWREAEVRVRHNIHQKVFDHVGGLLETGELPRISIVQADVTPLSEVIAPEEIAIHRRDLLRITDYYLLIYGRHLIVYHGKREDSAEFLSLCKVLPDVVESKQYAYDTTNGTYSFGKDFRVFNLKQESGTLGSPQSTQSGEAIPISNRK